jgi:putative membrane protein
MERLATVLRVPSGRETGEDFSVRILLIRELPNIRSRILVLFTALFICLSAKTRGQSVRLDAASEKMVRSGDVAFALKSAQCSEAQVRLGQLALQRATLPGIRAFGQQMIDEHSKTIVKLKSVAAEGNLTLPESLNAKDQATYTRLSNESGPKFDSDYVKAMTNDHRDEVKECQKETKKGEDQRMKDFASEMVPMLQLHLQKIEALRSGAAS